ncbi:hypothetical protein SZ54_0902 [Rhizobium sp. UR51a]|nr:hypothetical protein SZ54_0902 [Rhizobium sp. UR51a]
MLPNRVKETRPPLRPVAGPLTGFSHANGETTGHVGDIDRRTSVLKLQGSQQNTPDITARRWGGFYRAFTVLSNKAFRFFLKSALEKQKCPPISSS